MNLQIAISDLENIKCYVCNNDLSLCEDRFYCCKNK